MTSGGRAAALQANALLEAKEGFLVTKSRTKGGTAKNFSPPGWLAIAMRGVFLLKKTVPCSKNPAINLKRSVLIVKEGYQKYRPFPSVDLKDRHWPDAALKRRPFGAAWICAMGTRRW